MYSINIKANEIHSDNLTETFDILKIAFDNIKKEYSKKGYKLIESNHDPIFTAYKDKTAFLVEIRKS